MEYPVVLFVFVWCSFGLVADISRGITIEECKQFLDIRENKENNITCKEHDANATISFFIKRSNDSQSVPIATCTPFNCTLLVNMSQFTVQRSPQESQLVYRQQNRTEDFGAQIVCESFVPNQNGNKNLQIFCYLNVISPAILSGCVVEEDRGKGTVKGSCHFEHAFSARRGFTCTWYQTRSSDQSSTEYPGVIIQKVYTSNGQVYERGQCSLNLTGQQWNDGDYSYSIDFYPGPGRRSVPEGSLEPSVSSSTHGSSQSTAPTARTTGTTEATETTYDPASGTGQHSTTTSNQGRSKQPDTDDDSLPIAAIAGGAVAAVVAIIVVVVIVVVVVRRRRRRKPAEPPKTPRENDYWEEHINAAYVSCGGNDADDDDHDASLAHRQRPTPTTATTNNTNNDDTHADTGLDATADGDYEDADISSTEDGHDGYSAIGPTRQRFRVVPGGDDYAVVDDPGMGTGPNRNGTGPGNKTITDTYAVVDKSKKRTGPNRNGTAPVTETYAVVDKSRKTTGPNRNGTTPITKTYAVVDKSRKRNAPPGNGPAPDSAADDYSEAEPEGDPYSHLQLSSAAAAVKHVPPKKPTLKAATTQSAASDDVYNKLNFNQ